MKITTAQIEAARREYLNRCAPSDETFAAILTAAAGVPEQEHILQKPVQKPGLLPGGNTAIEAGEQPSKMFAYISGQSEGKVAELEAREEYALGHLGSQIEENEKLRAELATTIERCAQVAKEWFEAGGIENSTAAEAIISRIRALKDKP